MIDWHPLRSSEWGELADFVCVEELPRDSEGQLELSPLIEAQLVAQTGVRSIQVPLPRSEHCLVATDGAGIAAVCWWIEVGGPARVKLLVGAVARRMRGRGLALGDAMMANLRDELIGRAVGTENHTVMAHGLIHGTNSHSQALAARNRWFYLDDSDESPGYQNWYLRLDVPQDDEFV